MIGENLKNSKKNIYNFPDNQGKTQKNKNV